MGRAPHFSKRYNSRNYYHNFMKICEMANFMMEIRFREKIDRRNGKISR